MELGPLERFLGTVPQHLGSSHRGLEVLYGLIWAPVGAAPVCAVRALRCARTLPRVDSTLTRTPNESKIRRGWGTHPKILGTLKKASAAAFQGTGSDPL